MIIDTSVSLRWGSQSYALPGLRHRIGADQRVHACMRVCPASQRARQGRGSAFGLPDLAATCTPLATSHPLHAPKDVPPCMRARSSRGTRRGREHIWAHPRTHPTQAPSGAASSRGPKPRCRKRVQASRRRVRKRLINEQTSASTSNIGRSEAGMQCLLWSSAPLCHFFFFEFQKLD